MQQFESFAQMQRDAAMRVMEMQKRAQAVMRNTSAPSGMPVPAQYADSDPLCDSDPLREPEQPAVPPDNTPPPEEPEAAQHGLSDEESERALVTAILLLLMREKADERLLFALLYILI